MTKVSPQARERERDINTEKKKERKETNTEREKEREPLTERLLSPEGPLRRAKALDGESP